MWLYSLLYNNNLIASVLFDQNNKYAKRENEKKRESKQTRNKNNNKSQNKQQLHKSKKKKIKINK